MVAVEETTAARPVAEVLEWSRASIEAAMRSAVYELPAPVRHVAGYHLGWWKVDGTEADDAHGKFIRPALALLTAAAVGGEPALAVPAGVAIELVHNFSLLHDDVMDHDPTRRHQPTAWTEFGTSAAILAGDALLTLATRVLAGSGDAKGVPAIRMLGGAVLQMIHGQNSDLEFEYRTDVSLSDCTTMIEGKTGAGMGVACALGALYGGADHHGIVRMQRFGTRLGVAYQIVDDLLGIWGDPAVTGKPRHSDLRSYKNSMPVAAALSSGTSAGAALLELYERRTRLSDVELRHAAELIEESGARKSCEHRAASLLSSALADLRSIDLRPRAHEELAGLARFITRRDS
ncbi:polyprenyl synthetase family protein [Lentzea sp. NPDC051213]|uniref:polyprenyl synthetase family protein n=1 Tax=Lentzea sp. NPDC051213 TaxID=3364126 RepID=UPI0037BA5313